MQCLPQQTARPCGAASGRFAARAPAPARPATVCAARRSGDGGAKEPVAPKLQGAAAAALAASIMLASAAVPGEALAARSGGRVGGSSGFSSRSAAPRSQPAPQVRNYNTYVTPAPPLVGGYGYGYGGFGGISLFPTFVTPIGGGLFQFFFVAMIASAVIGAVRTLASSRRRDDKWDD